MTNVYIEASKYTLWLAQYEETQDFNFRRLLSLTKFYFFKKRWLRRGRRFLEILKYKSTFKVTCFDKEFVFTYNHWRKDWDVDEITENDNGGFEHEYEKWYNFSTNTIESAVLWYLALRRFKLDTPSWLEENEKKELKPGMLVRSTNIHNAWWKSLMATGFRVEEVDPHVEFHYNIPAIMVPEPTEDSEFWGFSAISPLSVGLRDALEEMKPELGFLTPDDFSEED